MTDKLRFSHSGGSIFENIGGKLIRRDPITTRRRAEQFSRDALDLQEHGNTELARFYARRALEAQLALSALESWKRCAG